MTESFLLHSVEGNSHQSELCLNVPLQGLLVES